MSNHKLKDNKLIEGGILEPEHAIAEFTDVFTKSYQKKIVASLNYGDEMLNVYSEYGGSMHINNVVELMQKLDKIWREWSYEVYSASRTDGDDNWNDNDME